MYDLTRAAAELFLEPADLREIYDDFFVEADSFITAYETAAANNDFEVMRQAVHGLKGMAANLRMAALALLARQAEERIIRQDSTGLGGVLTEIQGELESLREQIKTFYQG